jgi:hypothetical protein
VISNNDDDETDKKTGGYWWLQCGDIKAETESTIVVTLHQTVRANHIKSKILKEEIDSKWPLCKVCEETTEHPTLRVHFGEEWAFNEKQ